MSLRALKDRPFELLLEMERRAIAARAGQEGDAETGREWVGVAFRIGDRILLAPREQVREVLMLPQTTPVPGAIDWLRGLANVRGQLLPLTDLAAFLETESQGLTRAKRVLVVNHKYIPAGLIVDEVFGFRRFLDTELLDDRPAAPQRLEPFLTGAFPYQGDTLAVVGLQDLIESDRFLDAAG